MKLIKKFRHSHVIILTVLLSIFAYGLLIIKMGFYTDDWTFNWTYQLFGSEGLFSYFSTNRPIWGLLFQLTMPVLGDNPLTWHLFGLFWRIIASLSFYWLCIELWPGSKYFISAATFLFALYPGFLMQPLALTFGHIWIIYSIFIVSLFLTIKAVKNRSHRVGYTIGALLLSLINILCMEYFLPLEVIRLFIIFFLLNDQERFWKRFWTAVKKWLPYLGILMAVTVWRAFFFEDQTHIYSLTLIDSFKISFTTGLLELWHSFSSGIYQSAVYAWVKPFIDFVKRSGSTSRTIYYVSVALTIVAAFCLWFILHKLNKLTVKESESDKFAKWSGWVIAVVAIMLAGIPFYLTGLEVQLDSFASRYTLPFILGASLLLGLVLDLIPPLWLKTGLLSVILAVSFGTHIFTANEYRWLTTENTNLMYQLYWRAPGLKPNTLVVTNDVSTVFTYTTLKAELNLVYPHDENNHFAWIFARDLAKKYSEINSETAVDISYLVNDYHGQGSDIVVFDYKKGECLRFVDSKSSQVSSNILNNGYHRLSNPENLIYSTSNEGSGLNASLLIQDPYMNWCYYFEKADLALQLDDYESVETLYESAIDEGYEPNNVVEWYPFIEGLAANGSFEKAITVSNQVFAINPKSEELLSQVCAIWDRLADSTENNLEIDAAKIELGCP